MTTKTYEAEVNGRRYAVIVTPENRNKMLNEYIEVYRLRADGSRGLRLNAYHYAAWAAWEKVRAQVDADL